MTRSALLAACLGAAAALGVGAGATPSTIITIPSTDTVPQGTLHLDYDTLFTAGQGDDNSTAVDLGATYGLTDRLEVGFDYLTSTTNPLTFNAKYRVCESGDFAFAAGAWLVGNPGTIGANQLYGLAGYKTDAGRVAVGYASGGAATLGPGHNQLWLSWDKQLDDKWWAGVDYVSGESPLGALNMGVSYAFADNASLIVGYDLYNDDELNDTVTVQLDVNIE